MEQKEHELQVYENKVHREVFALKTNDTTEQFSILQNEQLLCTSHLALLRNDIKSGKFMWGGNVDRIRQTRNAYKILMATSLKKRRLSTIIKSRGQVIFKYSSYSDGTEFESWPVDRL